MRREGVLLVLLLMAATAWTQEFRATVQGTVTDPAEAVAPGVAVAVVNLGTGIASRTQTNSDGAYQVPYLQPGTYKLEISHTGFKTYVREPIELHIDERAQLDVKLEIGRATEQVTVTAEAGGDESFAR